MKFSENFILFVSTIAGEAGGCGEASWKAIAHVIMNRIGFREWKSRKTATDVIKYTGFDAATHKNLHFRQAESNLRKDTPNALQQRIINAVRSY